MYVYYVTFISVIPPTIGLTSQCYTKWLSYYVGTMDHITTYIVVQYSVPIVQVTALDGCLFIQHGNLPPHVQQRFSINRLTP